MTINSHPLNIKNKPHTCFCCRPVFVRLQMRRYVTDMVKVYSISVTNVIDGVASACRVCALIPHNSQRAGSSCVPCPAGFFIDRDTNRCQECPPNTHLAGRHTYGQDACVACGPGSVSNKVERRGVIRWFLSVVMYPICCMVRVHVFAFLSGTLSMLQRLLLHPHGEQPHADLRPQPSERRGLGDHRAEFHLEGNKIPPPVQYEPVWPRGNSQVHS